VQRCSNSKSFFFWSSAVDDVRLWALVAEIFSYPSKKSDTEAILHPFFRILSSFSR